MSSSNTTFNDIFRSSFVEGFNGAAPDIKNILLTMAVTLLIALYIFFVYRLMTRKTFYSKNFNISLSMLAIITAAVILSVQSSIVISLGMVGALSIVRFRTAIKDPLNLIFLFWSIGTGIICGAGLAQMAILTAIIITAGLYLLDLIPVAKAPMLLVINSRNVDIEDSLMAVVKKYCSANNVKSRNLTMGRLDMIIEVRVKDQSNFVREVASLEGITTASLLSHDGEVTF
ncbi:MAG: DUF4956 domain-containing protein [Clostridiales bacterium]|nr:DUF4956 domain-containing protein [Clostridiales bacterium]